jgi:hypothetical protein
MVSSTKFSNTKISNTKISNTKISNTKISNTKINNLKINKTKFSNTKISNTKISNTKISNTKINNTKIRSKELTAKLVEMANNMHWLSLLWSTYWLLHVSAAACHHQWAQLGSTTDGTTTLQHTDHITIHYINTHLICISSNLEGSKKFPDEGRLLPKHVGPSI